MSDRLRNNLIAGFIVVAFWIVFVIPAIVQAADPIVSETTQIITSNGTNETTVKSPPPSAIAPQIQSSSSDFLCTVSAAGAIQTQILGVSLGGTVNDELCELLQLSHALYNMQMRVAALSVLCNHPMVWQALMDSNSPCPIDGLIGDEAKAAWEVKTTRIPMPEEEYEITAQEKRDKALSIMGGVAAAFLFF
jgi:hypothetical protein